MDTGRNFSDHIESSVYKTLWGSIGNSIEIKNIVYNQKRAEALVRRSHICLEQYISNIIVR